MARYWIANVHEPGQCEGFAEVFGRVPEHLKGVEVWCTCPAGEHAFFMVVEGDSPESTLSSLPGELHVGSTRALEMAAVTL